MTGPAAALCATADCANPAPHGTVCQSCLWGLQADLRAIPDIKADLLDTYARLDRTAPDQPGGRVEPEPPLLFRPHAADADADLYATLLCWTRYVAEQGGATLADVLPPPGGHSAAGPWLDTRKAWLPRPVLLPNPDTLRLAAWLDRHTHAVGIDPEAGQLVAEIGNAVARARRATDRPGDRLYLGPCECTHEPTGRAVDLYAHPGRRCATCWNCAAVWDVDERRAWLLERSANLWVTGETATRALPSLLGTELSAELLRRMTAAGELAARPGPASDPRRRPRYRIGDIVAAVTARAQAQQRKRPQPPTERLPADLAALFDSIRETAARQPAPPTSPDVTGRSA